jgi:hypothetical protein
MSRKSLQARITVVFFALVVAVGAYAKDEIGRATGGGSYIEWRSHIRGHQKIVLRVIDKYGDELRREFGPGEDPSFRMTDLGGRAEDGQYTYELRVEPTIPAGLQKKLEEARLNEDDAAIRKILKENGLGNALTQSGVITIRNNSIVSPEGTEPTAKDNAVADPDRFSGGVETDATRRPGEVAVDDQVIPDDLIVQGSECVGFDCVDGESFGVDTIKLKENNLRIFFEDTSSSAGFASNDWRLIANEQPSGGANMFAIEDSTAARNPFLIEAAAPANSIYIDSTGNIGFQQSAPALDLHLTTSDTPALRLEQSNAGGFTAQTWDIGGNEANFFIRDLTGGSRLSFRIRPGAPTSSIDINASGQVGFGTANPGANYGRIQVFGTNPGMLASFGTDLIPLTMYHSAGTASLMYNLYNDLTNFKIFRGTNQGASVDFNASTGTYSIKTTSTAAATDATATLNERFTILSSGFTGVGNSAPTAPFMVGNSTTNGNGAHVTAGGTWTNGSSRAFKEHIEELTAEDAIAAVAALKPVRYNYIKEKDEQYVGFIAEDVPELVAQTSTDRHYLSPMDIVATLTKVVQEQQKTIDQLSKKVEQLEQKQ